jgi:hypothetical protein
MKWSFEMGHITKVNITKVNQFEINQKVRSNDYGHLGTIREFGYLSDTKLNRDWLKCQNKQWSDEEQRGIVVSLDVIPRGSAIIPISRLTIDNNSI